MADPSPQEIQRRIQELSVLNSSLQQRYAGEQNIFNAAAALANGKEMDEMRGRIHATVDAILDNKATLFMLTTMLLRSPPQY